MFEECLLAGSAEIWLKGRARHFDGLRALVLGLRVLLVADRSEIGDRLSEIGVPFVTPGVQMVTSARA